LGPQYWDRDEKIKFMDKHGIDISFVSSANPWLDFLSPSDARQMAKELNLELEEYCATSPALSTVGLKRLYGFGLLPLVKSISVTSILETISQISTLPHVKGVIIGTRGIGKGLDDNALEPVWDALAKAELVCFLHPHYGITKEAWGDKGNGHVLPLALGFPMETTIATTRLILAGVLDRHPTLRLLLAHSGGVLPQLSSRLASCIAHDPIVASRLKYDARAYLGMLWFDAVSNGGEELGFVAEVIGRARKYLPGEAGSASNRQAGSLKLLFGTDHPFFPPLQAEDKWKSVLDNLEAIDVSGWTEAEKDQVRGSNALRLMLGI